MTGIQVENVNQAYAEGLCYLQNFGVKEPSRNGTVIVAPDIVVTKYLKPTERVLFSPMRDANPFFHLMEALWMLAGRQDVEWPAKFAKNIAQYSDNGVTMNGAYGYRWRSYFEYDQLKVIVDELTERPDSRRAVLQIWDGYKELKYAIGGGKDACCNTCVYFDLRGGALNMTVCNRSNDAVWGAYGANAVHFSVLQEYLAAWLRHPVGVYRQFSNNFHVYTNVFPLEEFELMATDAAINDMYSNGGLLRPYPLVHEVTIDDWDNDLHNFMRDPLGSHTIFMSSFFDQVAAPMYRAWHARKEKTGTGLTEASKIAAQDWRYACMEWIARREQKKAVSA